MYYDKKAVRDWYKPEEWEQLIRLSNKSYEYFLKIEDEYINYQLGDWDNRFSEEEMYRFIEEPFKTKRSEVLNYYLSMNEKKIYEKILDCSLPFYIPSEVYEYLNYIGVNISSKTKIKIHKKFKQIAKIYKKILDKEKEGKNYE